MGIVTIEWGWWPYRAVRAGEALPEPERVSKAVEISEELEADTGESVGFSCKQAGDIWT